MICRSVGQALDVRRAMFLARSKSHSGVTIEERWYAPLHLPELLVHEIEFDATKVSPTTSRTLAVQLRGQWAADSIDLNQQVLSIAPGFVGMIGNNRQPELLSSKHTAIAVVANAPENTSVAINAGERRILYYIQAFVSSLNSTNVKADAVAALQSALAAPAELLPAHEAAWASRVTTGGGLEVQGDLWLAQSINASLYFIRSSIRPDWPHGLSPGGLASNGYGGHTFWDQ